ncbi:18030_t:CDS:2 [Funneliformis geosporum]|nr:18030_t:CDS:2 [Funneliformis geosporum]
MNSNNNIFNKKEVENKLKNFKEGQDYSIVPTDEPNVKTYNFHNDKLRSAFRGDKVPVRVTQEAYDGQDYTYRGHFEEGKDYRYTRSIFAGRQEGISEHSKVEVYGEEMRLIEENGGKGSEYLRQKYGENYFISPDRNKIIESIKQSINEYETKIQFDKAKEYYGVYSLDRSGQEVYCSSDCAEKYKSDPYGIIEYLPQTYLGKDDNNHSDLRQENQALRQQLSEVQKQLAKVLKELKKLKKEVKGEESEKLSQQIVQNERLMQESKHVSVAEVQEQVNKSQALMKELKNVSSTNNNKEGSMVPYVIGGSYPEEKKTNSDSRSSGERTGNSPNQSMFVDWGCRKMHSELQKLLIEEVVGKPGHRNGRKTPWRAEPVLVEMISDDLWLELKLLSNLEIAGSPRYSCRTSARVKIVGVEH